MKVKIWDRILRNAEGAGGGAGGEGAGGAGAGGGEGAGAGGGAGGGGQKWFDGADYSAEERQWLTAKGLAEDDPLKAIPRLVKGHRAAEQRIGKGLDTIMDRPAKDQKIGDWMRANADVFGLPAAEADYKIEKPEGFAAEGSWNTDLEAAARKMAFDTGMTPAQLQAATNLYAKQMGDMVAKADQDYQLANEKMMADLSRDFGRELPAKLAQARQAAHVLAEKAGLDQAGIEAVSRAISEKGGDAATIRMFAALGDMLGEDQLVRGGQSSLATTPAEARAELQTLRGPEGAYSKAVASGNTVEIARLKPVIERLSKIAVGR